MRFIETEKVELKKVINESIEKEIVTFLNTDGGTIYIGIEDNGEVVGVNNVDDTMNRISDKVSMNILPSAHEYVKITAMFIGEKIVVKIDVIKGGALYYIKKYGMSPKGCYLRVGTSCRSMSELEIEKRYIKSINFREQSMVDYPTYNQELTFEILKNSLLSRGYHINDKTFLKTYNLVTKNGEYNLLAELLADVNSIEIFRCR